MQASSRWSAPTGVLQRIVEETADRVSALRHRSRELERLATSALPAPSMRGVLRSANVAIIAEIKRRSPSRGVIRDEISARRQAQAYERGGAAAISVVTEWRHFGGSVDDLESARSAVSIPLLKKDFHIDTLQLLEARALGASAVLLIARALSPEALESLAQNAFDLLLEAVIEVRDEPELERALGIDGAMIGVNSRDLETMAVDRRTSERVLPLIPVDRIAIAESGVESVTDLHRLAEVGTDAVLVGSYLCAARDPEEAVRGLTAVPRKARDS